MRGTRFLVALLAAACLFGSVGVVDAAPKKPAPKQVAKPLDSNGDGKVGRLEKAAARPARAVKRQNRAIRRNNAVIQTIK